MTGKPLFYNIEYFAEWVDNALEQLDIMVDRAELKEEELEVIYSQMLVVEGRMINTFLKTYDERILGQIEVMQSVMGKVKGLRDSIKT
jgi:hypothetical protein